MVEIVNKEIRLAVLESGIKYWQLADALNIREETLSRRLRHELTESKKAEIMQALVVLERRKENAKSETES